MAGIFESYEKLAETFAVYSELLLTPQILIPLSLTVGTFVIATIVVALDGDRGRHVERAWAALAPGLLALIPIVIGIVLVNGGLDQLKSLTDSSPGEGALAGLILGLVRLVIVLGIVLLVLLYPIVMVVSVAVLGFSLVRASPDLIMILFLALAPVSRGLGTVLHQPFRAFRAFVYFFTKPEALKKVERVTRAKDARPEDIERAHHGLKEEFDRVNDMTKRRVSDFMVQGFAYNYHKFADKLSARRARILGAYNLGVARAARETRRHIDETLKRERDNHEKDT